MLLLQTVENERYIIGVASNGIMFNQLDAVSNETLIILH